MTLTTSVVQPYKLELHWESRAEPLVADAARLATFLSNVTELDPDSAEWDIAIDAETERLSHPNSVEQLVNALERQREAWLYGGDEFTACKILLVNSRVKPKRIQVTATCGASPRSVRGIWFANELVLSLWAPRTSLAEPNIVLQMFLEACRVFTPCWGCVAPPNLPPPAFPSNLLGVPKVGWMTYLSGEYPVPLSLAEETKVYAVPGTDGHCLVATSDWFDLRDPEHVARRQQLHDDLSASGALRPRTAET